MNDAESMHVLIASPLYPPDDGGPATYAKMVKEEFPKMGVRVSIVVFSDYKKYPKVIRHIVYCHRLFRSAIGVDAVFALDPVSVGLPAAIVSFFKRTPLVLRIVGDYAWEQGVQRAGVSDNLDEFVQKKDYPFLVQVLRLVQYVVARYAKRIIVPSAYLKSIVMRWGIEEGKINVVYNAFDSVVPTEDREVLRKKYGYTGDVVISVGRAVPWKGFIPLMDAVARILPKRDLIQLHILGSGDQTPYRSHATERGYEFVRCLGSVDHKELLERLRAADCFVLNTGYEGLSHLLLEAMAVGVPVVTTAVGGNIELIQDRETGLLASPNDVEQLSRLIDETIRDRTGSTKRVENSRRFVQAFTRERTIHDSLAVLRGSVEEK